MSQQPAFADRHLGPRPDDLAQMLARVGFDSLDELMAAAVPPTIASRTLDLPAPLSEHDASRELRRLAALNLPAESMIGLGYHATITPPVIRRNVLEDPSWYTAYTPYQPEISQGRLEALLNFQTVIGDLTGLPTANASLLDEGTAAAEAMTLVRRAKRAVSGPFVVDADALPQTIEVVRTRAEAMGIEVLVADLAEGLPERRRVRRPGPVPRRLRTDPRPASRHRRGARARGPRGGGGRPARADPARGARRARRRRRRRVVPALRRPDVLRRPPRRLHVGRRRSRAPPPRPAGRRLGRCRGTAGVPAGPADPRAAHPSRQGDVQHLHRPGAARRGRLDVRRVPRPRRAARDRRAHQRPGEEPRCTAASRRCRRRARPLLRHRARPGAGARGRGRGRRP